MTEAISPVITTAPTYLSKFDPASVAAWVAKDVAVIPPDSKNAIILTATVENGKPGVAAAYLRRTDHLSWELRAAWEPESGFGAKVGMNLHW